MSDYRPYPVRDPVKNYFPVPNSIFEYGMKPGEIALYIYLLYRMDLDSFQCTPSRAEIARNLRCSESSVRNYTRALVGKTLLATERRTTQTKNGKQRNDTLIYTVQPLKGMGDWKWKDAVPLRHSLYDWSVRYQPSAIKNYFLLPNEMFRLELRPGAIATYACLLRFENRESCRCFPKQQTIADCIGAGKDAVAEYVRELCERRLIETEPTSVRNHLGSYRNGTLLYFIRPIQEAIDYQWQLQCDRNEMIQRRERYERYLA